MRRVENAEGVDDILISLLSIFYETEEDVLLPEPKFGQKTD